MVACVLSMAAREQVEVFSAVFHNEAECSRVEQRSTDIGIYSVKSEMINGILMIRMTRQMTIKLHHIHQRICPRTAASNIPSAG